MAHPHLAETKAQFPARVHRTKNRLVSIPAAVQRTIGLARRADSFVALISLRHQRQGRWNHHYVKLTADNEFAIPADVTGIEPGDELDVKIHRIIRDVPVAAERAITPLRQLLELSKEVPAGWREDGSTRLDEYLAHDIHG